MPSCAANIVAESPTGPCPKIAIVSIAVMSSRFIAWNAVPVPQEQAAAERKSRFSGIGIHV